MKNRFAIMRYDNSDNLHLKLSGDFDDAAAMKLSGEIEKNHLDVHKIYVHTCGLTSVASFGAHLFLQQCLLADINLSQLTFTGPFRDRLAPRQASHLPDSAWNRIPGRDRGADEYTLNFSVVPKNNCQGYQHFLSL